MAEGVVELSAQVKQQLHILKKPHFKRTVEDLNKLVGSFKDVQFFKDLQASVRTTVCKGLKLEHFAAGATVFNEGDSGDQFYIILAGSVGVYIKEVQAQDVDDHVADDHVEDAQDESKPAVRGVNFGTRSSQDVIHFQVDEVEISESPEETSEPASPNLKRSPSQQGFDASGTQRSENPPPAGFWQNDRNDEKRSSDKKNQSRKSMLHHQYVAPDNATQALKFALKGDSNPMLSYASWGGRSTRDSMTFDESKWTATAATDALDKDLQQAAAEAAEIQASAINPKRQSTITSILLQAGVISGGTLSQPTPRGPDFRRGSPIPPDSLRVNFSEHSTDDYEVSKSPSIASSEPQSPRAPAAPKAQAGNQGRSSRNSSLLDRQNSLKEGSQHLSKALQTSLRKSVEDQLGTLDTMATLQDSRSIVSMQAYNVQQKRSSFFFSHPKLADRLEGDRKLEIADLIAAKAPPSPRKSGGQTVPASPQGARRYSSVLVGDLANEAKNKAAALKSFLGTMERERASETNDWLESPRANKTPTGRRGERLPTPTAARVQSGKDKESQKDVKAPPQPPRGPSAGSVLSIAGDPSMPTISEGEEDDDAHAAESSSEHSTSASESEESTHEHVALPSFDDQESVHSSEGITPRPSMFLNDDATEKTGTTMADGGVDPGDDDDTNSEKADMTDKPEKPDVDRTREAFRMSEGAAATRFLQKQLSLLLKKVEQQESSSSSESSKVESDDSLGESDDENDDSEEEFVPMSTGSRGSGSGLFGVVGAAVHAMDSSESKSPKTGTKTALAKKLQRAVRKHSQCQLQPKMQEVAVLYAGAAFGEVALQTNQPRSATIKTKEQTYFATLTRDDYKTILQSFFENQQKERRDFLLKIPIMQCIPPSGFNKISALLQPRTLCKNECVYKVGAPILQAYFAKEGEFGVCFCCNANADDLKEEEAAGAIKRRASAAKQESAGAPRKLRFVTSYLLTPPCLFGLAAYLMGERRYKNKVVCRSVIGIVYCILAKEIVHFLSRGHRENLHASACAEDQFAENRQRVLKHLHSPLERRAGSTYGRRRWQQEETVVQRLKLARGDILSDFSAYSFEGRLRTIGKVFTNSSFNTASKANLKPLEMKDGEESEDALVLTTPTWWMQKVVAYHPDAVNPRYGHLLDGPKAVVLPEENDGPVSSIPVYVPPTLTDYKALARDSWRNKRLATAFDSNCFHAPLLDRQPRGRADGTVQMARRAPVNLQQPPARVPVRGAKIIGTGGPCIPCEGSLSQVVTYLRDECAPSYRRAVTLKLAEKTKLQDVQPLPHIVSPQDHSFEDAAQDKATAFVAKEAAEAIKIRLPQIANSEAVLEEESNNNQFMNTGQLPLLPATENQSGSFKDLPMDSDMVADFFADHLVASAAKLDGSLAEFPQPGHSLNNAEHQGSTFSLSSKAWYTNSTTSLLSSRWAGDTSRSSVTESTSSTAPIDLDRIYSSWHMLRPPIQTDGPRRPGRESLLASVRTSR